MGFADEMAGAEELYEETEAAVPTGGLLSDGRHQAIISELYVEEGTYGWQLCWKFTGKDSKTGGLGHARKWDDLPPSEERMKYFKADLDMIGFRGKLSDIQAWCEAENGIGLVCTIFIQTKTGEKRDYTNVYINGCTGDKVDVDEYVANLGFSKDTAVATASAMAGGDDDIPF